MRRHNNNIGLLRLLFATMVIVGHAPELLDGNRSREPLTYLLPNTSMGEIAVAGFFILSGYLITGSMLKTNDIKMFMTHRILRIVPGYFVAFVISFFIVGPLLHVDVWPESGTALVNMALLREPPAIPQLALPYKNFNGALWTISYEFRCYVFVAVLWYFGLLKKRRFMIAMTAFVVALNIFTGSYTVVSTLNATMQHRLLDLMLNRPTVDILFLSEFLMGSCFRLYPDLTRELLRTPVALVSLALAAAAFQSKYSAQIAFSLFLPIPVFWAAFKLNLGRLQRLNDRFDISYGTYLYGVPIAASMILTMPGLTPLRLAVIGAPLAWLAGVLSWIAIERPAQRLGQRLSLRSTPSAVATPVGSEAVG